MLKNVFSYKTVFIKEKVSNPFTQNKPTHFFISSSSPCRLFNVDKAVVRIGCTIHPKTLRNPSLKIKKIYKKVIKFIKIEILTPACLVIIFEAL